MVHGSWFRVQGLGFGDWGLAFGVWGLGVRVKGLGFREPDMRSLSGLKLGRASRVWSVRCRV